MFNNPFFTLKNKVEIIIYFIFYGIINFKYFVNFFKALIEIEIDESNWKQINLLKNVFILIYIFLFSCFRICNCIRSFHFKYWIEIYRNLSSCFTPFNPLFKQTHTHIQGDSIKKLVLGLLFNKNIYIHIMMFI